MPKREHSAPKNKRGNKGDKEEEDDIGEQTKASNKKQQQQRKGDDIEDNKRDKDKKGRRKGGSDDDDEDIEKEKKGGKKDAKRGGDSDDEDVEREKKTTKKDAKRKGDSDDEDVERERKPTKKDAKRKGDSDDEDVEREKKPTKKDKPKRDSSEDEGVHKKGKKDQKGNRGGDSDDEVIEKKPTKKEKTRKEDSEDEEAPKKGKKDKKGKKVGESDDEDIEKEKKSTKKREDLEDEEVRKKGKKEKKGKRGDSDDEDIEREKKPTKNLEKGKKEKKGKRGGDSDDEDIERDKKPTKKKEELEAEEVRKKGKKEKKGKRRGDSDDEDEREKKPTKKREELEDEEVRRKGKKDKKGKRGDSDEDVKKSTKKDRKRGDSEDEQTQKKGKRDRKGKRGDESDDERKDNKKTTKKDTKREDSEDEEAPKKRKDAKKDIGKRGGSDGEDEDEDNEGKSNNKKPTKKYDSEEETNKKSGKNQRGKNIDKRGSDDEDHQEVSKKQIKKGKKGGDDDEETTTKGGKDKKDKKGQQGRSEEESDEGETSKKQLKKKTKRDDSEEEGAISVEKGKDKKGKPGASDEESEDSEEGSPKKINKPAPRPKKEEEEEEDVPGIVKRGQKANKNKKVKKTGKQVGSEDEDGDTVGLQKKKPATKDESSEGEEVFGMVKKGQKAKKKKAKNVGKQSDDENDERDVPSKAPPKENNKKALQPPTNKKAPQPSASKAPQPPTNKNADVEMEDVIGKQNNKIKDKDKKAVNEGEGGTKSTSKITVGFAAMLMKELEENTQPQKEVDVEEKELPKEQPTKVKEIEPEASAEEPKISRKERLKMKREAKGKPKVEAVEEKVEVQELDEYDKYLRAQEIKGRDPPPFVLLRTTEFERSKTGNDIKAENLTITVPGRVLLREANLTLVYGGRYGLIGRNGLGKSTLLQKIATRDGVTVPAHLRILYVEQEVPGDATTPLEYVLQADVEREWLLKEEKTLNALDNDNPSWMDDPAEKRAYSLKDVYERLRDIESDKAVSRASAILVGLGFDMEDIKVKPSQSYSGGWRMRIALARALFCRPEVLLLDEPTNHLDLHACFWLERYLSKWPKTLVVVSHEATFLNEVVDHITLLQEKKLTTYKGDYWHFVKARETDSRAKASSKDKQERKIVKLKDQIQKTKGQKVSATRKKELEKIEVVVIERDDPSLKVSFPDPDYLPPPLLRFCEASFGYTPQKLVFKHLDFGVDMDSKIALVGLNGVGKSTLMKLMAGELHETGGYVEKSRKIRIARFSQHHLEQLDSSVSAVQYLQNKFGDAGSVHELRQHLGRFGITGNLATNTIETLSGGQKSRVVLAELAWARPHILLLDEPSNHLDIDAVEALAQGLNEYKGGVVLISHNQRLISLPEIIVVTKQGGVERFNGEFYEYKDSILAQMDFGDSDTEN